MIKSSYNKSKKQYKVSFDLPHEQIGKGRDVRVLGNFNDWSWDNGLQLKSGSKSYAGTTDLSAGHYQFRYLVDGHHWTNDDSAESYTDSGHGTTNCCFSLDQVAEAKKAAAKKPAAKKAAPAKKTSIESAKSAPASKPVVTPKPAAPKKVAAKKTAPAKSGDDLKKIEGIGPKIAGLLNEAGIMTYGDLAKAKEKQLADVLQKAGARFRLAKHDTWQEQARLAAAGKTDELKKLQDELKGGTRK